MFTITYLLTKLKKTTEKVLKKWMLLGEYVDDKNKNS